MKEHLCVVCVALLIILLDSSTAVRQQRAGWKVCRRCKQSFDPQTNNPRACQFHKGRWIGAEVSKHLGGRSGSDGHTGLTVFWDCCDAETYESPGCMTGRHLSFDEEETWADRYMLNRGALGDTTPDDAAAS